MKLANVHVYLKCGHKMHEGRDQFEVLWRNFIFRLRSTYLSVLPLEVTVCLLLERGNGKLGSTGVTSSPPLNRDSDLRRWTYAHTCIALLSLDVTRQVHDDFRNDTSEASA